MTAPATRHLTILLTDIKGFTDKTSSKTRADIQAMLDEHRALVLPILESRGGALIKTIGDAFLMTFDSPTNAVLAGVAVQEALAKRNEGRAGGDRLEIRIAINAGEVNLVDGDVFGEAVNITARIEGIAEAGQVWFTEAVYLAMNKAEVPSSEIGLMQLKGIPEKIRVYKVRREEPLGEASSAAVAAGAKRLFGLLPPPAAKAVAAGDAPVPSTWRRFAALLIDGLLVALLASAVFGGRGDSIRASKRFEGGGKLSVAVKGLGLDVKSPDGTNVVYDDKKGLQVHLSPVEVETGGRGRDWGFAVAWFVYSLVFLSRGGATPGKKLMKLKVVSLSGLPLDNRQRVTRAAMSLVSGYAAGLGYLWAFWEPRRRGWHDLLAETRVVDAR